MKWWNKPLVISAVQCNYGENSDDIFEKQVAGRDFNTEQLFHLTATGHMAYYEEDKDGAKLDAYLEKARMRQIREIIYFNVHCITEPMKREHPEWIQLDHDGNPLMAYNVYYFNCINTDWFLFFSQNIKKLCSHDIDGIFLDGPVFSQQGCYCPVCQETFQAQYGKSLFEATYAEHMQFNVDSVTEYMRETYTLVKSINPDILLYINNSALRTDVTGSNTRRVEPYVDMIGAEGGFVHVSKKTSLWHVSPMAKIIETQAGGKPTVIFIAGDYKPYAYYMHTAEETKLYYAQSVANGANVWYGIHGPIKQMDTPGGRAAEEFNRFILAHSDVYTQTRPVSNVALMWSQNTANFYASRVTESDFTAASAVGEESNKNGNHYDAFMGIYEILMRGHVQHDIIDEASLLDGSLARYQLLILPNCACLSDEQAEAIRAFVTRGGRLLSAFDTGFYDEKGKRVGTPKLADVQGIAAVAGFYSYPISGCGYQKIAQKSFVTEGMSWELIPAPSLAHHIIPAEGTQIHTLYTVPMPGRYAALPEEYYPGIIENAYGKGNSVYFSGAVGEYCYQYTNPDYERIILNIVASYTSPLVVADAPGSVEVVLRRRGARYILHLVNITGEMKRPLERIIPLYNAAFMLNLDKNVTGIRSITGENPVNFQEIKGGCSFTVPCIRDYEVLIIE